MQLIKSLSKNLQVFLKHGANYVTADFFAKGIAFISIPIFTRLLTPEEYGIVAIYASFIAVFTIVAGLGIRGSVSRYYYEQTDDFNEYYSSNLLFVISWSLIVAFILFYFSDTLTIFFSIPKDVVFLAIGVVLFSTTYEIYIAYLQASMQSKRVSLLSVIKSISFLLLSIIITLTITENKYNGKVYAQLIIWSIFFFYSVFKIIQIAKINFKTKYLKYSLVFGIPIVFHLISQFVLGSFDQIIINQIVGQKETGLYSFAYQIGAIQSIITFALLRSWTPMFYQKLNERKYIEIEKLSKEFSILIYTLAICLSLFSEEIIVLFADKAFYSTLETIPIVVLSYVLFFLYVMYVGYAFYSKKTYFIAIFTILAGLVNIGLNYWLIPQFGYQVAAWTTLISYTLLFVFHYLNVRFIIKPENIISLNIFIPNLILTIVVISAYYMYFSSIENYYLQFGIKVLLLIISLTLFFWNRIKQERVK